MTENDELWRKRFGIFALLRRQILWGIVLANFQPGPQDAWVNYKNDDRAPLLFISATDDHLMPPSVQRSNATEP